MEELLELLWQFSNPDEMGKTVVHLDSDEHLRLILIMYLLLYHLLLSRIPGC